MFMTFYNVDMEKAKNINDLLEEYERMEAIIDLFFKKDVENKELEELRRWLTVSINYFRRFQKVLSTLKIKDEKIIKKCSYNYR
jgi:predicted transcriptional regulator